MKLSDPIQVGSLTLHSHLVMPPMAKHFSEDGTVNDRLINYYKLMTAGGYLGLATIEHSYVSPEGSAGGCQISASRDSDIPGLEKLADAIHANNVPTILQINHAGSEAHPADKQDLLGPDMSVDDVQRVRDAFIAAAVRAQKAGFDGVEVHSAHGYLLSQFYSPLTNHRTDAYAGDSLVGRTRLQAEILRSIRQTCGEDFLLSIRFGASDYMNGGATVTDAPAAAKIFEDAGADMISVSGGLCRYTRKGSTAPGWFAELSRAVKTTVNVPVMLTGGIETRPQAEIFLNMGDADLIGIGRAFMKNPGLPKKLLG